MWIIQVSENIETVVDADVIEVSEDERLVYFIKNPKDITSAETVAVYDLNDIIGTRKVASDKVATIKPRFDIKETQDGSSK